MASATKPLLRLALLFAASYGLLYFSYKYDMPRSGGVDFFQYYKMYLSPLDFTAAPSPFVYRQLSAIVTHWVYTAHIYYPNTIWFQEPGYDQRVFFAALLTNYFFLVLTAWVVGAIVEQLGEDRFMPATLGGLLCLLSFETQVSVITGLTEGLSWFLLSLAFLFYLRRNALPLAVILTLAIVQRETTLIVFAAISGISLLLRPEDRRFNGFVFLGSLMCCVAYLVMRIKIVPAAGAAFQTDPVALFDRLKHLHVARDQLLQGFASQNLLWLFVAAAFTAADRRTRTYWLPVLLGAFLVLVAVSLAAASPNNVGRIAAILHPLFAAFIAVACARLERTA
jgi:hypothetical protein